MKKIFITLSAVVAMVLSAATFAGSVPQIVSMYPAEGATDVPLTTEEVTIEFDQKMAPTFSLFVNCDEGICYKNGYWKTPTTFVVKSVKLIPGKTYKIGIGNPNTGMQQFGANGIPCVPVWWNFTAAKQ